jgi:hypothetical protein
MKAEELRIGIWVYLFGDAVQLTKDHLIYLLQKDGLPEPITLTPEWLSKFGFYKETDDFLIGRAGNKHEWHVIYKLKDVHVHFIHSDYGGFHEDDTRLYFHDNSLVGISNVHSLQNLYYALTGQELKIKEPAKP